MCAAPWFREHLVAAGLGATRFGSSYVQSDCRAIDSLRRGPLANFTPLEAVGWVLNTSSCDVDCPGHDMPSLAWPSVNAGLAPASALDTIATRLLTLQFLTGRFDPVDVQPFTRIGLDAVDSAAARALAHDAALQGIVLLRNDGALLPLTPGSHALACVGPYCNATADFLGNYFVTRCPRPNASDPKDVYTCIPTLSDSLRAGNGGASVTFSWGCDTNDATKSDIPAAVAAAHAADIVVLALGTNAQCPPSTDCTAAEGKDRTDSSLPGAQTSLALAVLAVGKPTILVFVSGSSLGFDALLAQSNVRGIVWAGHVGEAGGAPIAESLFGVSNRFGKLPHTLYPLKYTSTFPIDDFAMAPNETSGNPGRTYKYYPGPVLFPAFFGLSYTTFAVTGSCNTTELRAGRALGCFANVTNTGARSGDEVVTVFIDGPPPLIRQLVDFARVTLAPGESASLPFEIAPSSLALADTTGARSVRAGHHTLTFCSGAAACVPFQIHAGEEIRTQRAPALNNK